MKKTVLFLALLLMVSGVMAQSSFYNPVNKPFCRLVIPARTAELVLDDVYTTNSVLLETHPHHYYATVTATNGATVNVLTDIDLMDEMTDLIITNQVLKYVERQTLPDVKIEARNNGSLVWRYTTIEASEVDNVDLINTPLVTVDGKEYPTWEQVAADEWHLIANDGYYVRVCRAVMQLYDPEGTKYSSKYMPTSMDIIATPEVLLAQLMSLSGGAWGGYYITIDGIAEFGAAWEDASVYYTGIDRTRHEYIRTDASKLLDKSAYTAAPLTCWPTIDSDKRQYLRDNNPDLIFSAKLSYDGGATWETFDDLGDLVPQWFSKLPEVD